MQDTELKFFAEAPTDAGGPSKRSGGIRGGGNIEGDAVTTNQASRDRDQVAEAASNKSTKKKKKGKARPAVSQRGPLLITHSGELKNIRTMRLACLCDVPRRGGESTTKPGVCIT